MNSQKILALASWVSSYNEITKQIDAITSQVKPLNKEASEKEEQLKAIKEALLEFFSIMPSKRPAYIETPNPYTSQLYYRELNIYEINMKYMDKIIKKLSDMSLEEDEELLVSNTTPENTTITHKLRTIIEKIVGV
ncbi:MAG: hypothetical protein UV64_C0007G0003 [Parcubacteria group bacterium GW2011_GWC1_43_11b]|nr:MAG: hypothetical protein UV64_C0007G0003 [Parcubacteria group bacterium GW2011_GWC1_43_11b]